MTISKAIEQVTSAILQDGARKATKYLSRNEVVKASLRGKIHKHEKHVEMVLTVGKPNYAEQKFIKAARKAGEPFPVKRVVVKRARREKAEVIDIEFLRSRLGL